MNRNKKILIFALLLILILVACSPEAESVSDPAELTVLKMNGAKYLTFAPIFIADSKGYFEDQNIKIEYVTFTTATDALPALVTGEIDIFAGVLSSGLLNLLGKEDIIKVVADRGYIDPNGCTFMALLLRKDVFESGDINGPSDLEGLTISSNEAGALGYFLDEYLAQGGLSIADLDISKIPPPSAGEALGKGQLAGSVLAEPWLTRLENSGNAVPFVNAEDVIAGYQIGILAFGEELIKNNRDAGTRFMSAYLQGVRDYNQGKTSENLDIVAEFTELDREILNDACWPSFQEEGSILFSGVKAFQDWAIKSDLLDTPVTEGQFWDPSFIEDVKALDN